MSRKRPAPGADPVASSNYQQIQSNHWQPSGGMDQKSSNPVSQDFTSMNLFNMGNAPIEPSNQLTRRGQAQLELAPYGNSYLAPSQYGSQQPVAGWNDNSDDELDRQAEAAQRIAKEKKKSIPPFVQKLRSFVDDEKNSNLIRWSEDGESFIVLDEDEFAKKLIPELFKHNKYPSFVRQLNMYGFHKRVALSDNSMRASERKSKSPSEYHNPYFKRGRPTLMWLIQKPKTSNQSGKKGPNGEEEEDEFEGEPASAHRNSITLPNGQRTLTQEARSLLHEELTAIRRNQATIQEEVRKLREENELMQTRAAAYQAIHQRHENSINAILTFLATVFRNQIEGGGASQLANMFPQAAPREQQQGDRVVDMSDFDGRETSVQSNTPRPTRRPLLLEAAPADANTPAASEKGRISSASTPTATDFPNTDSSSTQPAPGTGPSQIKRESGTGLNANDDILSFLNSQSSGPGNINRLDYPQALSQLENANSKSPMSIPQRNDLLRLMANNQTGNVLNGNSNNALTSPSPPPIPGPTDAQWDARKKEIERLERSIREQDDRFNSVTSLLGPLSPSGSINFMDSEGNVQPPPDFDIDWLNTQPNDSNGGLSSLDNTADDTYFDFKDFDNDNNNNGGFNLGSFGGTGDGKNDDGAERTERPQGRVVGTAENSEAASPATVNTIEEGGHETSNDFLDPPQKRQRTG